MPTGYTLFLMVATGIAIVAGSAILGNAFTNTNTAGPSNILGSAEAAILPLDVKETFRTTEKTGDAKDSSSRLDIDSEFIDPDEHCEFCYRIEYKPGATGTAGAILKANKAFNLEEAKRLYLFARGESGDESVQFSAAGKYLDGSKTKALKFAFTSENMVLEKDWKKYEIDLSNADLTDITHGFGFEVGKSDLKGTGKTVVIYLKGITFDTLGVNQGLPAAATDAPTG